jgi:peroxiredoxin
MQLTPREGTGIHLDGVLLAILIGSLGINVYFGIRKQPQVVQSSRPEALAVGTQAPSFEGQTLDGAATKIDYARNQQGTLLYVFSPTCVWCERNLANITAIVKARPDVHVVGVALGPPLDAKDAAKLPFAAILRPVMETAREYKLGGTPTTILISPSGKVLKVWPGAYTGPVAADVSKALAVTLPGLVTPSATSTTANVTKERS